MTLEQRRARRGTHRPVHYPESDGKPMGETDLHRDEMFRLIYTLQDGFAARPDVYVSGNLLLYYVKGNPAKCVAPDVFVARGVGKHDRRTYKLWEENRPPETIFEISSRQTWRDDLQEKWRLYEQLGVREYFIFDPEYDYLDTPLIGYRLDADGRYAALEVEQGRLHSETLGLDLVDTGETLRLFDPRTNQFLPTPMEEAEARRRETEARQQAEAENARLRAELARLRGETP